MTESIAPPNTKPEAKPTKELAKVAVSGWLGTAMEFMDFQLYSLAAAIVFNKLFFPDVSPVIGLIAAHALALTGPALQASVLQASMPAAVVTTVIALEFDLEPAYMTSVVVATTVVSPFTLTLLIAYLQ